MKVKLSSAQIWVLEELHKEGSLLLNEVNHRTLKKLLDLRLIEYNDRYDRVVLSDTGKSFKQ